MSLYHDASIDTRRWIASRIKESPHDGAFNKLGEALNEIFVDVD